MTLEEQGIELRRALDAAKADLLRVTRLPEFVAWLNRHSSDWLFRWAMALLLTAYVGVMLGAVSLTRT